MRLPIIALCLLPTAALAALPPQYQRQAELVRIIQDPDVTRGLQDEPIESITPFAVDVFEVRSQTCFVRVIIIDIPGDHPPGPRQFEVVVNEATCQ
jgi:hypothetical protein